MGTLRWMRIVALMAIFCVADRADAQSCTGGSLVTIGGNTAINGNAQDVDFIYFGDATGALRRVPKAGGGATTIVTESGFSIAGVALDANNVYYAIGRLTSDRRAIVPGSGAVKSVAKSGGTPATLASGLNSLSDVKVDETHVYVSDVGSQNADGSFNTDGKLIRVPKAGGAVQTLAQNLTGGSVVFAMDATDVYFGENGGAFGFPAGPRGVRRVPKAGGAITSLTDAQPAYSIFLDGNTVYFSVGFGLTLGAGGVYGVPKAGGPLTQYAADCFFTLLAGVADGLLYISCDNNCGPNGYLATIPISAPMSAPTHIRDNLNCGAGYRVQIDGCAVYAFPRGSVERVCRTNCTPQATITISSVAPNSGSTSGGTRITITGTNFASGATVSVGGSSATNVTVVNSTTITATTPARAAGTVNVVVTNPDGTSATANNAFTYADPQPVPPTITQVSPSSGPTAGGTAITITGTNFVTGATVTVGGVAATNVTVVNATTITAVTPAHAAGAVSVVVTNPDGASVTSVSAFTYVEAQPAAPTIISITPTSGPAAGGTTVTITGTNFAAGATVTVGGVAATNVTVASATTITAVTPAHAAGAVNVVVTNPGGMSVTAANAFTYVAAQVNPTITAVAPNSGPTAGGTAITITGTNFASGATVTVGGVTATSVSVVNATTITAVTPAHAAGAVNVVVTNPGGASATANNAFTYVAPAPLLTLTGVSPASGPTLGGRRVTLTGTGFVAGMTVTFGGRAAKDVQVVSSTTATVTTPPHKSGTVDVVITLPADASATLRGGYRYVQKGVFF